jgi:hypothetical protein
MTSKQIGNLSMRAVTCDVDGVVQEIQVVVEVNPETGTWSCKLPAHVKRLLKPAHVKHLLKLDDREISAPSVAKLREMYESYCEQYQRQVLASKIVEKIGVRCITPAISDNTQGGKAFAFAFEFRHLTMVEGTVLLGAEARDDDEALLDDTPEVRAKIQRLTESFHQAASVLHGIGQAKDPTAYLLSVFEPEKPAAPAETKPASVDEELAALEAQVGQVAVTLSSDEDEL